MSFHLTISSRVLSAVFAVVALAAANPCRAETYVFDKKHSEVRFTYKLGPWLQHARFLSVSGTLEFDEAALARSNIEARIETASLTTGDPMIESQLKGADFFNVIAEPAITFKSRSMRMTGTDAAEIAGDITVNGITKPIMLQVTFQPSGNPVLKHDAGARQFIAKTRVQRSAFKMTAYAALIADEVDFEIDAILRKQ